MLKTFFVDIEHKQKVEWMIFFRVKELDQQFARESRKVAFIVDNFPVHPKIEGLKAVELAFLLANATSKAQPMDQGVIRFIRVKY